VAESAAPSQRLLIMGERRDGGRKRTGQTRKALRGVLRNVGLPKYASCRNLSMHGVMRGPQPRPYGTVKW